MRPLRRGESAYQADEESVQTVKRTILHPDANVNKKDRNGRIALRQMARNGNIEITNPFNVGLKDHGGLSGLRIVVANGHPDLAMLLRKSDVNLAKSTHSPYDRQHPRPGLLVNPIAATRQAERK